jgi:RNA polymerase sigma factor (TIGR02999 family)
VAEHEAGIALAPGRAEHRSGLSGQLPGELAGFVAVYDELREVARRLMRREIVPSTLDPTGLVNEVYLRLLGGLPPERRSQRDYVFGAALQAMGQILVERVRARKRFKRGGGWTRIPLDDVLDGFGLENEVFEQLHQAIGALSHLDDRQAQMVRMRYFLGLTDAQIAEHFDLTEKTVDNQLSMARGWLRRELARGNER